MLPSDWSVDMCDYGMYSSSQLRVDEFKKKFRH